MSLTEPTKFETAVRWAKGFRHWKIVLYAVAGLAILGLVLFAFDKCGGYWTNRGVEKKKEAVNAKIEEIKTVDAEIANLQVKKAEMKGEAKELIKDVAEAEKATDDAASRTDKALERQAEIDNAPLKNVNAADLEEKLRNLP